MKYHCFLEYFFIFQALTIFLPSSIHPSIHLSSIHLVIHSTNNQWWPNTWKTAGNQTGRISGGHQHLAGRTNTEEHTCKVVFIISVTKVWALLALLLCCWRRSPRGHDQQLAVSWPGATRGPPPPSSACDTYIQMRGTWNAHHSHSWDSFKEATLRKQWVVETA